MQVRGHQWAGTCCCWPHSAMPSPCLLLLDLGQAFFVIQGEGGGEILEEEGTFSGQALLLSYPYPMGGRKQVTKALHICTSWYAYLSGTFRCQHGANSHFFRFF